MNLIFWVVTARRIVSLGETLCLFRKESYTLCGTITKSCKRGDQMKKATMLIAVIVLLLCGCSCLKNPSSTSTLKAPTSLVAFALSNASVELMWNDNSLNEAGFVIERSLSETSGFAAIAAGIANQTTFEDTGLCPNTIYYYRVMATTATTKSPYSNVAMAKTLSDLPGLPGIPIPQNIQTVPTVSTITLTWDAVADATSYEVQESVYGVMNAGSSTNFVHRDLLEGTTYYYRVRAVNSIGAGNWSAQISETTLRLGSPQTPQGLSGQPSERSVYLTWNTTEWANGYEIETDGEVTDRSSYTEHTHIGLLPDSLHTYRVRAYNSYGPSPWSAPLTIRTLNDFPEVPKNVRATPTETTVTITWDELYGADRFDIEVDNVVINNGTSTTYVHSGLIRDTQHTYRVRGVNEVGAGPWSALLKITTLSDPPGVPTGLYAVPAYHDITINWNAVSRATGYHIATDDVIRDVGSSTFYVNYALEPGSTHAYKVRAYNPSGTSDWSETIYSTTAAGVAPPPSNIWTSSTQTSVTIEWEEVEGASGYDVEINGVIAFVGCMTKFTRTGFEPNTKCVFRLRSLNAAGQSPWTEPIEVWTLPIPPTEPEYMYHTATQSTLDNIDDNQRITGYELEGDGRIIYNGSDAIFLHTGLLPDTQHVYRVRAYNEGGYSNWSQNYTFYTFPIPPPAPTNIVAEPSTTSITLTWDAVEGANQYSVMADGTIYRSIPTNTYTHTGLTPGTTHTYKVKAFEDGFPSEWSEPVTVSTLLETPENLAYTPQVKMPPKALSAVGLMVETGLRIGEVASPTLANVIWKAITKYGDKARAGLPDIPHSPFPQAYIRDPAHQEVWRRHCATAAPYEPS